MKMRAETSSIGGVHEGKAQWGCAPGRQTRTWESPDATGRSRSTGCTESMLPAPGMEGSCTLLAHLEASEILNSGPPESTLPQPITLLPPCCALIPQGWMLHGGWLPRTASSWAPEVFLVCSWCRLWWMTVRTLSSHLSKIACRLFIWNLPFSPSRFIFFLVTFLY